MARRCELLLALGEARVRSGERPLAWAAFREAATLAARLGDKDTVARAAIGASTAVRPAAGSDRRAS